MKFVEFTYTKPNGEVSRRSVVTTQEPRDNLAGIDISALEEAEFANFYKEYNELKNKQASELQELLIRHDLNHSYREFVPGRMSDVTAEWA